jgi:hypothetical protein
MRTYFSAEQFFITEKISCFYETRKLINVCTKKHIGPYSELPEFTSNLRKINVINNQFNIILASKAMSPN